MNIGSLPTGAAHLDGRCANRDVKVRRHRFAPALNQAKTTGVRLPGRARGTQGNVITLDFKGDGRTLLEPKMLANITRNRDLFLAQQICTDKCSNVA